MSLAIEQANSFSSSVQNALANQRAQNNAVMDSFHQQIQETREADYIQGAQDIFKNLKSVTDFKSAIANNSDKYSPVKLGQKVASGFLGEETAQKLGGAVSKAGTVVTGGLDLYEDIKDGGVQGDNLAKQTANISAIAGAGLDVLSIVAPEIGIPLDLLGAGAGLVSSVAGGIGDVIDAGKSAASELQDAGSELSERVQGVSLAQSGQIEDTRTS
jgi:hypothetical protein